MSEQEAIKQMESIIENAESFFTDDGDDGIWRNDKEACEMAIVALERQRWIPCIERMPKTNYCRILCFVSMRHKESKYSFTTIVYWEGYLCDWRHQNGKKIADYYEVIAWCRVTYPEPYKEEQA